jgi:hypothetical protein
MAQCIASPPPSHIHENPLNCDALSDALRLIQNCIATMLIGGLLQTYDEADTRVHVFRVPNCVRISVVASSIYHRKSSHFQQDSLRCDARPMTVRLAGTSTSVVPNLVASQVVARQSLAPKAVPVRRKMIEHLRAVSV